MVLKSIKMGVLTLLVFMSGLSWGLMPPLSKGELKHQAKTIVLGNVVKVVKTGRKKETSCASQTEKVAILRVKKYIKDSGNTDKELNIYFWDYHFKEGCVGSPDHRHFVGESGRFYLNCQKVTNCRLVHWNGVEKE